MSRSADRHDDATERTDDSERGKVGHSSEHRAGTIAAQERLYCGVYRKDLDSLSWHCRARKTCIDD